MDFWVVKKIVEEELERAKEQIIRRLEELEPKKEENRGELPKFPDNEYYDKAFALYSSGASHSQVSRELGTAMNNTKRYYNWLVNNGYLIAPKQELSEREKEVVECIYTNGMSLNQTAQHLGISVPNVSQRRNSALRKGFKPM